MDLENDHVKQEKDVKDVEVVGINGDTCEETNRL